jgi:hypothetical protein
MNLQLGQGWLVCLCWFALTGQALADSITDSERADAMAKRHLSGTTFFEWIENEVSDKQQFLAVTFSAGIVDAKQWARCQVAVMHVNKKTRQIEMSMSGYDSDKGGIENLSVDPKAVSFDLYWGVGRTIRFVATRKGLLSSEYEANAVARWTGWLDETKTIKIEWKQVPSITLPFPTIAN